MNLRVGLLLLAIGGLGLSTEAMAQEPVAPSACRSDPNNQSFRAGVASGRALARQAWAGVGDDCLQVQRYASILLGNVERLMVPPGSTAYVTCRHSGIVAGVYEEVIDVWRTCAVQSCAVGDFVGQIAGTLVCAIANGLGPSQVVSFLPGLPPTAFPGLSELCCETAFDAEIQQCLPGSTFPWDPVRDFVCEPPGS